MAGVEIGDIRRSKEIPEDVKDLIVDLISRLHSIEKGVAGSIELAYRRGIQARQGTNGNKDKD